MVQQRVLFSSHSEKLQPFTTLLVHADAINCMVGRQTQYHIIRKSNNALQEQSTYSPSSFREKKCKFHHITIPPPPKKEKRAGETSSSQSCQARKKERKKEMSYTRQGEHCKQR